MVLSVSRVGPDELAVALSLLFARFPPEEQSSRLADAMRSAQNGTLNLDGLLLATEKGNPVGAALSVHQPDGVTLVWPPVVTCHTTDVSVIQDLLMIRLCEEIDRAESKLAQALLTLEDDAEMALLQQHAFEHAADMFFIARAFTPKDLESRTDSQDLEYETFADSNSSRFASTIERTYLGSLDCPFLDGYRNGQDALVSHKLSGCFDPAGWRLYRVGTEDVGVLMTSEHPDQDAIELVYFGIVPEFRGKGIGRRVLAHGLHAAALTGRAAMFLAVDCGNIYANSLYGELAFNELARRRVMIRRFSKMARE